MQPQTPGARFAPLDPRAPPEPAADGRATPEADGPRGGARWPGIPIVVLSATLAQRGVAYRSMGTDLPASALIAAVRRTAPAAILLWSQLPETADPDLLTYLPQTRPAPAPSSQDPAGQTSPLPQIARLNSLQEATNTLGALAATPASL